LSNKASIGGFRLGADFEVAVEELIYRLGYSIYEENLEVPCKKLAHKPTESHEADLLVSFDSDVFIRPWCSSDNPIIDCKHSLSRKKAEDAAKDLLKDIDCFKEGGYKVDGGILITNSNIRDPLDKIGESIFLWDQKRLFLYSFKVFMLADMKSAYDQLRGKTSYKVDLLKEHVIDRGITFLWGALELQRKKKISYIHDFECFYDLSTPRINISVLNNIFEQIKSHTTRENLIPANVYITFHSLSGFTRNVKTRVQKIAEKVSSNDIILHTDEHQLFDYSIAPWQTLLGIVYE